MENDIKQQQEHFDSIAEKYFKARQSKNSLLLRELMWKYFLKNKAYLKERVHKVLEPMCGYGEGNEIIEKFVTKAFTYEGFDYSKIIVSFAKKRYPHSKIEVMNVLDLEAKEDYDLVIIVGGLHHVFRHARLIIKKIYDSLILGGYFICYEPTNNNFIIQKIRNRVYKANPLIDEETEKAFGLKELNKNFSDAGFSMIDQIYPGLLSYVLYYNPDAFPLLNFGNGTFVKICFSIDRLFLKNWIGRKFSFATLSLLQKK